MKRIKWLKYNNTFGWYIHDENGNSFVRLRGAFFLKRDGEIKKPKR